MTTTLAPIEEEVIFLKATTDLINSMVNFEVLDLLEGDPESEIRFRTRTHQSFFNIALVDFLSCTDKKGFVRQRSYLGALKFIAKAPNFNVASSANSLAESTDAFVDWLEQEVEVAVWFPSINKQIAIRISRATFLKVCGNISKHNFLRLIGVADEVREILEQCGEIITRDDALLALPDFYQKFASILNYHGSTIAEFLNNIRWGIHEYLQPEYKRSIVWEPGDPPKYRFTNPIGITTNFARNCYWEIMNDVRGKPYVNRFKVTRWLKLRY